MSDSPHWALVSVRTTWNPKQTSAAGSASDGVCVTAFARSHQAGIGKGWSFDREEPTLTGAEQLLGILSSDVLGLFLELVKKARLAVDEAECRLQAVMHAPLAYLGVIGAEGVPRYDQFVLQAYVSSAAPADQLRTVWAETLRRAPLYNTLLRAADVRVQLTFS
jgi:hypothetical protein